MLVPDNGQHTCKCSKCNSSNSRRLQDPPDPPDLQEYEAERERQSYRDSVQDIFAEQDKKKSQKALKSGLIIAGLLLLSCCIKMFEKNEDTASSTSDSSASLVASAPAPSSAPYLAPAPAPYTPHTQEMLFNHKVGALGGGNDLETGSYTLNDAWQHSLKIPSCVGFTYKGVPNQQGKVQCYFKSSPVGNTDPNWQTYLKKPVMAQAVAAPVVSLKMATRDIEIG